MKVALVYTSKKGMATAILKVGGQELNEDDDEPPPSDMFAECDSDETILAIQNVLQERWEVIPIESDENAFSALKAPSGSQIWAAAMGSPSEDNACRRRCWLEAMHSISGETWCLSSGSIWVSCR